MTRPRKLRRLAVLVLGGATTVPSGPCEVLCDPDTGRCATADGERRNGAPFVTRELEVDSRAPRPDADRVAGQHLFGTAVVDWETTFQIHSRDPDGDAVLTEWDLNGDGEFEQGGAGRLNPSGIGSPGDEVRTFYRGPGAVTITTRISDFPEEFGAPGEVTRTRLVPIITEEERTANRPPQGAAITVSPPAPRAGQEVHFQAAGSDPDRWDTSLRYFWRFGDNEGGGQGFDLREITRTFSEPGTYTLKLSVADALGVDDEAEQQITVRPRDAADTPPQARFTFTPAAPVIDQPVTFDGSESTDAEGPITRYQWDLDGNGSFETDGGRSPTTTSSFGRTGEHIVRLQVTDSNGATDVEQRVVVVRLTAPSLTTNGPLFPAAAGTLRFSARVDGNLLRRGGQAARGTLAAGLVADPGRRGGALARRLRRFLGARWRMRIDTEFDASRKRLTATATALARPQRDRRNAACLRLRLTARPGQVPSGRITLLGGTGTGARLTGTGSFRFRLERDGAGTAIGQLKADEGRKRPLPRVCEGLR